MKRSRSIRLVHMGAVALTLAACDEPVEVGVFQTVGQCMTAGHSQSQCETAIEAAWQQHEQVAPRYASLQDCESEFGAGQCTPAPDETAAGQEQAGHSSVFMPLMAGYMMGRMMGGSDSMLARPLYRPATGASGSAGAWYTAAGARVARTTGMTSVPSAVTQPARPQTTTLSRGGFGARAARFSGVAG